MKLIKAFEKQSGSWILAEAFAVLAVTAFIDVITNWQFSLFVFYCAPVFIVALHFPRRIGVGFVIFTPFVATAANYDTVPFLGLGRLRVVGG